MAMLSPGARSAIRRALTAPCPSTRIFAAHLTGDIRQFVLALKHPGVWRDRRGAGAIEFAIVAPLFLLIVLGLLVYGIYLGSVHSVEQLAADAARASVAGLSDTERTQIATAHVITNTPDYPLLDVTKVSVVAGPSATDPSQFRVSVRFDASDLPIWSVSGLVPMPDRIIERTSVIKRGGY